MKVAPTWYIDVGAAVKSFTAWATENPPTTPADKASEGKRDGTKGEKRKTRKKRNDPKVNKKVADAYIAGGYRTEAAASAALEMTELDVHRARDRHRKREGAKAKARRK